MLQLKVKRGDCPLKNKIVNYIADKGKVTIFFLQFVVIILFIFYKSTNLGNYFLSIFFNGFLKDFLTLNAGNLISLSAIFLGIYFTLFTLISTLDINSWITNLPDKRFKEIISLIKNGFSITFVYVLYLLLVNSISENTFYISDWFYELIFLLNFLFCLYILLIALVVATIIYTAYQKDISEFNKKKKQKELDEKEFKLFISQSKKFFDTTDNSLTRLEKKINEEKKKNENK